jgi:hypothetical protein
MARKQVLKRLRTIPVDAGRAFVKGETGGRWCIVAGDVRFVSADGQEGETAFDDEIEHAVVKGYLCSMPERVHSNYQSALEFVRSKQPDQ